MSRADQADWQKSARAWRLRAERAEDRAQAAERARDRIEKRHNKLRSALSCAHMDLTTRTVAADDLVQILNADTALAAADVQGSA